MTAADLDAGKEFARYKDIDGDGIPWRTYPGTHASKGAYFTRGTTRNPQAMYSERGPDYIYNMERLLRKFKTAANLVPQPVFRNAPQKTKLGVIYYGSTTPAMREALDVLEASGVNIDAMRLCAFPFPESVSQFVAEHDHVFVVEQNRDAQMRMMLINELETNPAKLVRVLHYDGTPITARFIVAAVKDSLATLKETV
jgi:2-oxoglutarate ferredoxin oxidoreductase subunit alpha